jgi:ribonuclease R
MEYTWRMNKANSPGRDAILDLLCAQARALHAREIAARLHVEDSAYPALLRLLEDLAFSGAISPLAGQRFRVKREAMTGRDVLREGVLSVNPRGFGFVSAVGYEDDLFISEDTMRGGMHGDLVRARLLVRTKRGSEGEIVEVVSRSNPRVPGTLRRRGKNLWLVPDDERIRGPIGLSGALPTTKDGDAAVAKITRFPEMPRETPEGEIEVVLGTPGDPNVEVAKILVRGGVEEAHPPAAVREAEAFGKDVSRDALAGREDLTGIPLPTIDPEDARDHDDAVWARRNADGSYTVWVAIADVSHYVRPGTELDAAALARSCSIYFPDRAIPMLPSALSSNLCSLLPGVIRLCLCVQAEIDAAGAVKSHRVVEGYMRSAAKLTYEGVARTLGWTSRPEKSAEADRLVEGLRILSDVAAVLRAQRMRRGALDFDVPEAKVVLDSKTGAPTAVERRAEDPGVKKAYGLVEELMLLANEIVARQLTDRGVPTIYRVHGSPDDAKLERLAEACTALGIALDVDDAKDPKKLSALIKRTARHPKRGVFNMLLLRSMKQAAYDIANIGHFGLASPAYLHFTSPIRRYPDLVVHRTVRAVLRRERVDKSPGAVETLRTSATVASERERAAMEIEREVVDLYRALYMRGHVGETLCGTVTGLVGSGVFVQLTSPFVDVLVKSDDLGRDKYDLSDDGLRVVGARSGDTISLGDEMTVTIDDVAIARRSVYGKRADAPGRSSERARPSKRPKGKARPTDRPQKGRGRDKGRRRR